MTRRVFSPKRLAFSFGVVFLFMLVGLGWGIRKNLDDAQYKYTYKIFADMQELDVLSEYITEPGEDPDIGNLTYLDSFCNVIEYEDGEYLVCAYVFPDVETSKLYFTAVWDEEPFLWEDYGHRSFSYEPNPSHSEYMIYSGNCALRIQSNTRYRDTVMFENWLAESLSEQVPEQIPAFYEQDD